MSDVRLHDLCQRRVAWLRFSFVSDIGLSELVTLVALLARAAVALDIARLGLAILVLFRRVYYG